MASSPRPQSISTSSEVSTISEESPDYVLATPAEGSASGPPSPGGKGEEEMGYIPTALENDPVKGCIEDRLMKVGWRDMPAPYGLGHVPGLEDAGWLDGRDSPVLDSHSRPKARAQRAGGDDPEPIGKASQDPGDDTTSGKEAQKRWRSSWERVHALVDDLDQIFRDAPEERRARHDKENSS